MVDIKYNQRKIDCFNLLKKRLADMKPGESILGADLTFIAMNHGFGYRTVDEVITVYKDMGLITVIYEDGRAYSISKPSGEVFDHA